MLELGNQRFLLDAGFSCKRISSFLENKNMTVSDLSGVFVTHEHEDHIKGLRVLLKKANIPVYASRGTIAALKNKDVDISNAVCLKDGKEVEIEGTRCFPFEVPHDATEPLGLRFENRAGVISVATDLGHVTPKVMESLDYSDIVCLESNYDEDMLKICSYPFWLKKRIRGNSGHLANTGVRGIVSRLNRRPESLILMHLSQESNTPALVRENLEPFLSGAGSKLANTRIYVMDQDEYSPRIFQSTPLPEPLKRNLLMKQASFNFSDLPEEELG